MKTHYITLGLPGEEQEDNSLETGSTLQEQLKFSCVRYYRTASGDQLQACVQKLVKRNWKMNQYYWKAITLNQLQSWAHCFYVFSTQETGLYANK